LEKIDPICNDLLALMAVLFGIIFANVRHVMVISVEVDPGQYKTLLSHLCSSKRKERKRRRRRRKRQRPCYPGNPELLRTLLQKCTKLVELENI